MIRTRTPLAVAVIGALTLAACGGDDDSAAEPVAAATDEEMSDGEMADDMDEMDDMSDDEMADDEMADDEMADDMDEMSDGEMADDEMADDMDEMDDMSDGEMADDEMADDMDEMDDMSDGEMADDMDDMDDMSMNDVMSLIANRDDLGILDEAIHAADLQDTLHTGGPFTIFAPTDDAFAAYLGAMGMSAEDVFADPEALSALLLAHVVEGADDAAMVMGMAGQSFTSLAGTQLDITADGDTITVGGATIVEYDVVGDNGVIHVIDAVIAPPAG